MKLEVRAGNDAFSAALASRLGRLVEENFSRRGELGAAVAVWRENKLAVEITAGYCDAKREIPWTRDTLVLIWSATKGLASACLLHVLQEHGIDLQRRVAEFWPSFGQAGKGQITLAQLLSHQAGLAALDQLVEITDFAGVIHAIEKQAPLWPPGTGHGYHARTFGFLLDQLVRQIDGRTIGDYWRDIFAGPLDLDLWIGLPTAENYRTATVYAARATANSTADPFYRALVTPGTLQHRVFGSPRGLAAVSAMNQPENRARSIASLGAVGNAVSLAKFYMMLASGGVWESHRFFYPDSISWMTKTLAAGPDKVFEIPTAFSAGFMKDAPESPRPLFGPSELSFGHPGAGGSHAFADPEHRIAFAYVMNQMERSIFPTDKSLRLLKELYALLSAMPNE